MTADQRTTAGAFVVRVGHTIRRAWHADVFHLLVSMGLVQGGAYIAQLAVASILGPGDFGHVRIIDTAVGILMIPAGLGMSSAVVRYTATAKDESERHRILSYALSTVLLVSMVIAGGTSALARLTPLDPESIKYLQWVVWVIVVGNISRTIINYFQGRKEIRRVAGYNIALALVGAGLVVAGAIYSGLAGWAMGRVGGEAILCLVLLFVVRKHLATLGRRWPRPLLMFGGFVALSLTLDRVATTADNLYLAAYVPDPGIVGQYGIAQLCIAVVLLVSGAVNAVALPYLSERAHNRTAVTELAWRIFIPLCVLMGVITIGLATAGPWLLQFVLGTEYELGAKILRGLAPTAFIAGAMSFLGTLLLSLERPGLATLQSFAGVLANVALNALLIPPFGVWGVVWAAIGTYTLRAILLVFFVSVALRRIAKE